MNLDKRLLLQAQNVRLYMALTVGTGLLLGVAIVLQAHLLSRIATLVFLQGYNLDKVQGLLGLLLATILARSILVYLREVFSARAAIRIKTDLREQLFAHLLALGPIYTRGERTGELINTATEGIESLDAYFSQYLPNLAVAALIPPAILAFVFPIDPLSGAVFLLTAPLIPLFMVLTGKIAESLSRKQWDTLSRMSAHFLDVLQGLATLKLFGRSRDQARSIFENSNRYRQATMRVLRVAFLSALALELLSTIGTAIVAVEIGLRLLYGQIAFQQAFFILILAPEVYLPLRALGAGFHAGLSGVSAAQRLFAILEVPVEMDRGEGAQRGQVVLCGRREDEDAGTGRGGDTRRERHPRPPSPAIRFEGVHYSYDGGRRPALRGVSFEIAAGEKVALVGPSGSGKSTLAYLLLRFMEPDRGTIMVGGLRLSEIPPEEWRRYVAWVPQIPYLLNATVEANLRIAKPEAGWEEILDAAEKAHAHCFIQALPEGYRTLVGERGERLSGGQCQRLAIARAVLKNAPLLILDEATSNLDPELDVRIQESIGRLAEGRTVLAITHQPDTIRWADRILLLSDGQIAESEVKLT